jgi:hypothetical protein
MKIRIIGVVLQICAIESDAVKIGDPSTLTNEVYAISNPHW